MVILKNYIKQGKKRQSDIVRESGLSQSMIAQLQSGRRRPNPYHAIKLEKATNGELRAEDICPQFFKALSDIGFSRSK